MQEQNKQSDASCAQAVYDNIWASPVLFVFVSLSLFLSPHDHGGNMTAWAVYFAGWAPPVLMGLRCLKSGRKPDLPAAPIGLAVLAGGGLCNFLLHNQSLPV
ncbi:hypothetical protein H181DRAFT_00364 [Streptomyces sp. WMMB 714]|uniref:hypothetical protein n=1 Tax=Streptomyces sp. WMMB 714 TaxID=1286822 RepID=UPI0005F7BDB4|nr:hypothetical protein [Streptomyces sp. WMMB 714]SCK08363.1 hypothetical protein H181DRAFT_00364 [Streptomyces sp. WMMB 714]